MSKKHEIAFGVFIPLLIGLLVLVGVVWYGNDNRLHVHQEHYEQLDAVEDVVQQLAISHIWLEEYITSGAEKDLLLFQKHERSTQEQIDQVGRLFDRKEADWLHVQALLDSADRVLEFGQLRLAHPATSGTNTQLDNEYDALFEVSVESAEVVEQDIRKLLAEHMREAKRIESVLLIVASLLIIISIWYVYFAFARMQAAMSREINLSEKLVDSEAEFHSLFDMSPVAMWLEDFSRVKAHVAGLPVSGTKDLRAYCETHPEALKQCVEMVRIIDVNVAAVRMHGAESKEQLLAGLEQTFTEKSYEVFRDELLGVLAGEVELNHQAVVRRLDGTPIDVLVAARVMPGHEEALDNVLVALLDITERVKAEGELSASEARLKQAQGVADVGSWEIEYASGSLLWSDEVLSIYEIDKGRNNVSREVLVNLVHPEDLDMLAAAVASHLEEGAPYDIQYRLRLPDGRIKYVQERCVTERDSAGKALRSLGTVQDVSGRVEAEQAKVVNIQRMEQMQRLESLGVLAGGIAHDFNNLLAIIMGHAGLAKQLGGMKKDTSENLSAIIEASQKAAELCKQMLAYSGKGKFVVQALDLSELIGGMTSLLKVSVGKGVVVRAELEEGLPAIEADVEQVQQVVMNLVINAGEAIEGGSGTIDIATGVIQADAEYLQAADVEHTSLQAGRYVWLEVGDTGSGMDEATRKQLFEPFFTTRFVGRGLGMSAVLGIVRGHKGAIRVYSEPGEGTSIKILFPAVEQEAELLSEPDSAEKAEHGTGTVLVVDDEEHVRSVAALMLEEAGYRTMLASDGQEGVDMLRRHVDEIDCVLLDMTMPRMAGDEAFVEMRRIKPDIRVVLSSGYNRQTATQYFTGKGLAGFVQKPYMPDTLLAAVGKAIQKDSSPDA